MRLYPHNIYPSFIEIGNEYEIVREDSECIQANSQAIDPWNLRQI